MTDLKTMSQDFTRTAARVFAIEAEAINDQIEAITTSVFSKACQEILNSSGRLIVIGMGKSGHIGHKLAATLASTGTPAFFVHPAEASHGDLGMIANGDIVICLSNSGETQEISQILPALKHKEIYLISITGNKASTLARASDAHIYMSIKQEACPLDLAPTASTTAMLAICDALAVALLEAKKFSAEDFALSHPAGRLGKRLLLHVADLMHRDDQLPHCNENASLADALIEMSAKRLGMVAITNEQFEVVGIFTDGDARRTLTNIAESGSPLHSMKVADWMSTPCTTSTAETLAFDALHLLQEKRIGALAIVNADGKLIGALNFHDLLNAGL